MKVKSLSRVQLFATPGTVAYQAPLSMGFSRQEYWSGVPDFTGILVSYVQVCIHMASAIGSGTIPKIGKWYYLSKIN